MVRRKKDYRDFVCSKCLRQLPECKCEYNYYGLINIDEGIQDTIRILNEKKYTTTGCCEGHYRNENDLEYVGNDIIFVSFAFNVKFDKEPIDFKWNNRKNMYYYELKSRGKTKEEYYKDKIEHLKILLDWAESLPVWTIKMIRNK